MSLSSVYKKLKGEIKKIQRSDAREKKKWFWGGSAVSVFIILLLWSVYLSVNLPTTEPPETTQAEKADAENSLNNEDSFLKIFGRGLSNISEDANNGIGQLWDSFKKTFESFKNGIEEKNTMNLKGSMVNFVNENIEPIPPTQLP